MLTLHLLDEEIKSNNLPQLYALMFDQEGNYYTIEVENIEKFKKWDKRKNKSKTRWTEHMIEDNETLYFENPFVFGHLAKEELK